MLVAEHGAAEKADEDALSADEGGEPGDKGGVETIGGDDSEEVESRRPRPSARRYKIQEVIKRRQILLVQVVKEERGNKGAALTTYISLAGRYCVLMPNTARGGGISRKITNGSDRKKLRSLLGGFGIPQGMAVIVRTAGAKRVKTEIKRDYECLFRTWNDIRELTLKSIAPALIHEEANLIKRSIRDLYSRDIDEIIIDGEDAYRTAKDFIKLLIPSHAKKVQPYKNGGQPMMQHYQVESQLDIIHSPEVQLKSGGYIVINPTEALVSIDVNSGRATRERNIEENGPEDQPGGVRRDRPPFAAVRPRRPHRHRFHRHGGGAQQREGGKAPQGGHAPRPRPHPVGADQSLRAPRAVPPEAAPVADRNQFRTLSLLRRLGHPAFHGFGGIEGASRHRGGRQPRARRRDHRPRADGGGTLRPQSETGVPGRPGIPLRPLRPDGRR